MQKLVDSLRGYLEFVFFLVEKVKKLKKLHFLFYFNNPTILRAYLKRRHVYEAARPRSRLAKIIELLYKYNKNIIILIVLLLVAKFQGNIPTQSVEYFLTNGSY